MRIIKGRATLKNKKFWDTGFQSVRYSCVNTRTHIKNQNKKVDHLRVIFLWQCVSLNRDRACQVHKSGVLIQYPFLMCQHPPTLAGASSST